MNRFHKSYGICHIALYCILVIYQYSIDGLVLEIFSNCWIMLKDFRYFLIFPFVDKFTYIVYKSPLYYNDIWLTHRIIKQLLFFEKLVYFAKNAKNFQDPKKNWVSVIFAKKFYVILAFWNGWEISSLAHFAKIGLKIRNPQFQRLLKSVKSIVL